MPSSPRASHIYMFEIKTTINDDDDDDDVAYLLVLLIKGNFDIELMVMMMMTFSRLMSN